jgi:FAD/FMN-containing dehydrogenase
MRDLDLARLDGGSARLATDSLNGLREAVGEQLILQDDPRYDHGRRVWNGMIDRHPSLIVRCRGVADVLAAVQFAREHEALLAVRGGGHNVAGYGTCDGGVVIDLSPMRHVRVDPAARTARVSGGATWADVDRETQVFGQAVPGGIVSTTGVAGLTLGGGQGWLRRTYGMASDSLKSVDIVTAAGDLVTASESQNADLFWALRGGGGNFGVVTSFEFHTFPVGPRIAFAGPVYPLESAAAVMAGMRRFAADAPNEVNLSATWWSIPAVDAFPAELHARPVIILGAVYVGDPELGEGVLRSLREIESPLLDLSATLPYVALQKLFDPFFPSGKLQYYWKSIYLAGLEEDAVKTVAEHVAARPSSMSMVGQWALGGALDRVEASATATGRRGAPYLLEILANWREPADSTANIAWARDLFVAMERFGTGKTNLNFPGLGDEQEFTHAALGEHWDRLVTVKRRFDPGNLFRLNQNIRP